MTTEAQEPIDWDARLAQTMVAFHAKQARKAEVRAEFAAARALGLRQRHAQKLQRLRNKREAAEQKENE